ncbi:MAG: KH domain-containing protein [Armatimonadetes bacterium]|nr:KH domain-containing protein [Armatimonadota bacterium]
MESIEIVAGSLDEAIAKAAAELGVEAKQVEHEVLEETKGLFGKGQVRIRANAKKPKARPVKAAAAVEEAPKAKPVKEKPVKAAAPAKPAKEPKAPRAAKAEKPVDVDEEGSSDVVATRADADAVMEVVDTLLDSSGLDVRAEVADMTGKYINLRFSGRDVSYLVGRRGEVLNAFQYLMNVICSRQFESGVRVVIDGDDYRRRRQEVLEKLALDIAAEVKKRGEEAVLDALPAFERRVIHQALTGFDGVLTYSEGEEPERRVVIAPAEVAS